MKAIVKERPGAGACYTDVDRPIPSSHQVLVRVRAASFCGTDLHIYKWTPWAESRIHPPMVFGHEFAGDVVDVGAQVERIRVGDHIAAESHLPCFECYQCRTGAMHICQNLQILGVDRPGCFAEYVAIPEICAVHTDPALPWEIATLQEPFGNSVYAVTEAAVMGKRVAIFGDGPTGIFATAVARAFGATQIFCVGLQPYRLALLRHYAPDRIFDAAQDAPVEQILQATRGLGVDVVLEMSGAEAAIHQGFRVVRKGGTFVAFGLPAAPIPINFADELIFKGIQIKAINGRQMFATWEQVQNLLLSGRVDLRPVITHTFPMAAIDTAMQLLTGQEAKAGKIVLTPGAAG
ncbi:MAG: alcohol dehydrogenase catalytic domain-containing protein [Deltaproteobacteria bacterium]|nr:alcohol dehydrogenase catalytic domain-containing protein [Deltaproteobacteria bacterium]